jgi:hypothetical protein
VKAAALFVLLTVLPGPPTEAERRAYLLAGNTYTDCLTIAAKRLDDGNSKPAHIGAMVASQCERPYRALLIVENQQMRYVTRVTGLKWGRRIANADMATEAVERIREKSN